MFPVVSPGERIEKEHNLFFGMAKKKLKGRQIFLGRVGKPETQLFF